MGPGPTQALHLRGTAYKRSRPEMQSLYFCHNEFNSLLPTGV